MKETIQLIKDLAKVTENSYLLHKIDILESEIEIAILNAELEAYDNILLNAELNDNDNILNNK